MHVLKPYFSVIVGTTTDFEKAKAENYPEIYMITIDGVYKYHRLGGNDSKRYICMKESKIPDYELMNPPKVEVNFLPDGKVPTHLFDEIVSLYREVMRVNNGRNLEAMAWILWTQEDGYFIHVPKQRVSGASVDYDWDIPKGSIVVVDTHSHNSMGAFFSGTDDGDDRRGIRFSGVIGKITNTSFETKWRFCYQGRFIEVKMEDIFGAGKSNVPQAWMDNIELAKWGGYSGGYGGGYGYSPNSTSNPGRGRADHLIPHRFQSGSANPNHRANPQVMKDEHDGFQDEYEEYYRSGEFRDPASVGPATSQNFRSTDGRNHSGPVAGRNTNVTSEDHIAKIVPIGGNPGNVVAGLEMATEPAKDAKDAKLVGVDGKPLGSSTTTVTETTHDPKTAALIEHQFPPPEGKSVTWGRAALGESLGTGADTLVPKSEQGLSIEEEDNLDRIAWETLHANGFLGILSDDSMENLERDTSVTQMIDHPRFDDIAVNHGVNAANAFCIINEMTEQLNEHDSLIMEIISDLFQMLGDGNALQQFRSLYSMLSPRNQNDINSKGI